MRKAAETLLSVIGTDREIGTHAAVPENMALSTSIKTGEDVYHHFGNICFNKEEYRDAIKELAPYLGQMSPLAFSRLMGFAQTLEFHLDSSIGNAIKASYSLNSWDEEQLEKRAKFLQTFSRTNPPLYTLQELKKEANVKAKYPWQWIDATKHHYPRTAQDEIIVQVIKDPNSNPFLWRIPGLVKEMPEKYMAYILANLEGRIPKKAFLRWKKRIEQAYELRDKVK